MAQPYDFEQITVSNVVKTLTAAKYDSASNNDIHPIEVVISCKDDNIRYTVDGTTPTASLGMRLLADQTIKLDDEASIRGLQMIREATDAEVNVSYFKA
jgi:hypothetical protein